MDKINKVMERLLQGEQVQWKTLNDVFNLRNGYTPSRANKRYWTDGSIPWFRMEDIRVNGSVLEDAIEYVHESGVKGKLFPENSIMMATTATVGVHALVTTPHLCNQQLTNFSIKDKYKPLLDIKFVYYYFYLICERAKQSVNLSSFPSVRMTELRKWELPIPPLHVQEKIVSILDTFTELIKELTKEQEARQTQYEYYRDKLLTFEEGEVEWKTLNDVFNLRNGYTPSRANKRYWTGGSIPWFRMEDIRANGSVLEDAIEHVHESGVKGKLFPENSIILATSATVGIHALIKTPHLTNQRFANFSIKDKYKPLLDIKFVYYYFYLICERAKQSVNLSSFPSVRMTELRKWEFPIPPLHVQEEIVNKLDHFNSLANSITEGLPREIELRQKQYEYYRDLLLSFPKAA